MMYRCSFCKYCESAASEGEPRICMVRRKEVEPWFSACKEWFEDRRQPNRAERVRSERRKAMQVTLSA